MLLEHNTALISGCGAWAYVRDNSRQTIVGSCLEIKNYPKVKIPDLEAGC